MVASGTWVERDAGVYRIYHFTVQDDCFAVHVTVVEGQMSMYIGNRKSDQIKRLYCTSGTKDTGRIIAHYGRDRRFLRSVLSVCRGRASPHGLPHYICSMPTRQRKASISSRLVRPCIYRPVVVAQLSVMPSSVFRSALGSFGSALAGRSQLLSLHS